MWTRLNRTQTLTQRSQLAQAGQFNQFSAYYGHSVDTLGTLPINGAVTLAPGDDLLTFLTSLQAPNEQLGHFQHKPCPKVW